MFFGAAGKDRQANINLELTEERIQLNQNGKHLLLEFPDRNEMHPAVKMLAYSTSAYKGTNDNDTDRAKRFLLSAGEATEHGSLYDIGFRYKVGKSIIEVANKITDIHMNSIQPRATQSA